jgi:hypothetical protein
METFEGIETSVGDQVLEHVSPKSAFFCRRKDCHNKGKTRTIRSCIGKIKVTNKQASPLGREPYRRFSPLVEKCCLLLAAKESFQDAENDLKVLMERKHKSSPNVVLTGLVRRKHVRIPVEPINKWKRYGCSQCF